MPFSAAALIAPLLYYQRRAKKLSVVLTRTITIRDFCSQIDLGGTFLLTAGFAMFLIPFSLAGLTPSRWNTSYIIALIVIGAVTLVGLVVYEIYVAAHPILPARYFRNLSIVICCSLGFLDTLGFEATHTYLYPWATIVHNMGPRDATFLNYTNGVWQCLVGIVAGAIMYKTRRYKWLMVVGTAIKLLGFGLMIRLRGANNSLAELLIVQSIQGWGSGIIEIAIIVGAQVVVPHAEMAQVSDKAELTVELVWLTVRARLLGYCACLAMRLCRSSHRRFCCRRNIQRLVQKRSATSSWIRGVRHGRRRRVPVHHQHRHTCRGNPTAQGRGSCVLGCDAQHHLRGRGHFGTLSLDIFLPA